MKNIILASASPRRKELLQQMGIEDFTILPSDIEEKIDDKLSPSEITMSIANQKATDIYNKVKSQSKYKSSIVLGADTIVVYKNMILGKPSCDEESKKMLQHLSGETHQVITGYCLIDVDTNTRINNFSCSSVTFKELNDDIIDSYIKTGEPTDKAGSYGIQGKGAILVKKINGCYFNIVGLPITKLADDLLKFNIKIL